MDITTNIKTEHTTNAANSIDMFFVVTKMSFMVSIIIYILTISSKNNSAARCS